METKHITIAFLAFSIVAKECIEISDFDGVDDRILICRTFYNENLTGAFFSCIYNRKLRIHVVFQEDTDNFNQEIFNLIKQSMQEANLNQGKIWIKNSNESLIAYIGDKFHLTSDSEQFFYNSTEYIMRRNKFNKTFDNTILDVKPYGETHIDEYLKLLNDAMAFKIPPHDYIGKKEHYMQEFRSLNNKRAFEAFWKDGKLVGLYWLEGTEIDHLAVSSDFQRAGYGSMILTRAIEMVLMQYPDAEYAVLYCVGWNSKAQNFYKRYGMEVNGQYQVPYVDDSTINTCVVKR